MQKACYFCDNLLHDEEPITIVYDGFYRDIPSRVHFSVSAPEEISEMYHRECYERIVARCQDEEDEE